MWNHLSNMDIQITTNIKPEVLAREITISCQDDYIKAGDVLKMCKSKVKDLDAERKTYTAPLDESKKLIMAKFKEVIDPIEAYIAKIDKAMGDWYLVEEKRRQEEQKRLEEEAIKNTPIDCPDVIVPVVESIKTTRGNVATNTAIKYYEFEVVNPIDVPKEYWIIDEDKIKKAINAGGIKQIPGIKIIEKIRFNSR